MIRVGPSYLPSQDDPAAAIEWVAEHGFSACGIDFERPLTAFVGRPERDKKFCTAVGMLDHTAGLTATSGAELMVVHPGYLFGRTHTESVDSVVSSPRGARAAGGEGARRDLRNRGDGSRP